MKNNSITKRNNMLKPQEEFLRQVIFMKDDDKDLAVFPFYHEINENEYNYVVSQFFDGDDERPPRPNELCLMYQFDFGWGWIHKQFIDHLEIAEEDEYFDLRDHLMQNNIINSNLVLNEDNDDG